MGGSPVRVRPLACFRRAPPAIPEDGRPRRLAGREWAVGAALGVVACLLFAALAPNALRNGDAAVYLEQIQQRHFTERTIHLAYYLIGVPFLAAHPGPDALALNHMSAVFGGLAVAVAYWLGRLLTGTRAGGCVAALLLAVNAVFVENAVLGEVYVMQAALMLLAVLLWFLDRPIATGLAFGASVLVSPQGLLAAPAFVVWRPRSRSVSRAGLVAFLLVGLALAPVLHDYLLGGRGLLRAASVPVNYGAALRRELGDVGLGLYVALPFAAVVVWTLRQPQWRVFGAGFIVLWTVQLLFGERFADVPVQLPAYALLMVVVAAGIVALTRAHAGGGLRDALVLLLVPGTLSVLYGDALANPGGFVAWAAPAWLYAAAALWALVAGVATLARPLAAVPWLRTVGAVLVPVCLINGTAAYHRVEAEAELLTWQRAIDEAIPATSPRGYVVVAPFTPGALFDHYNFDTAYAPPWISVEKLFGAGGSATRTTQANAQLRSAVDANEDVWMLGRYDQVAHYLEDHGYVVTEPYAGTYRAHRLSARS